MTRLAFKSSISRKDNPITLEVILLRIKFNPVSTAFAARLINKFCAVR